MCAVDFAVDCGGSAVCGAWCTWAAEVFGSFRWDGSARNAELHQIIPSESFCSQKRQLSWNLTYV